MGKFVSVSADATRAFAREFVRNLPKGSVVCLNGEPGAGKTVFVQGCMEGLGYKDAVTSPTFALCNVYNCGNVTVSHYDLYRISGYDDLWSVGFFDDMSDIIFVEWACNVDGLTDECIDISFTYGAEASVRILESESFSKGI